jgi:hypothetical protein
MAGQDVHPSTYHFTSEYDTDVLMFVRIITFRPMQVQVLQNLRLSLNHTFPYKDCPRLWPGAKQNEETSIRTDYQDTALTGEAEDRVIFPLSSTLLTNNASQHGNYTAYVKLRLMDCENINV